MVVGHYFDLRISSCHIQSFVARHGINMQEAEKAIDFYGTFNEFFTRRLKPQARPIDQQKNTIISPVDGTMLAFEALKPSVRFPVKGYTFSLREFLGDDIVADSYSGGTMILFRLAPQHYHRFHFPIACVPREIIRIRGRYESVHPLAYGADCIPLVENERQRWMLDTVNLGQVAMVTIGAMCVGKILQTCEVGKLYCKGDEAGYFAFGGSSLALLFRAGMIEIDRKYRAAAMGQEVEVKMGHMLARCKH